MMSTILDEIVEHKKKQVEQDKQKISAADLMRWPDYTRTCLSLRQYLLAPSGWGVIAEFKRKSPSAGPINLESSVEEVVLGYAAAGVSALSILTDEPYFAGRNGDLKAARPIVSLPILRKEFIVDEYQIIEAKAMGADAILLIAECLERIQLQEFTQIAKQLGLEVLTELHDAAELDKLNEFIDVVGVNNRNLKNFKVEVNTSKKLFPLIPDQFVKISESGISKPETIVDLKTFGFQGFLIGENFMRSPDPAMAAQNFMQEIRELWQKKDKNEE